MQFFQAMTTVGFDIRLHILCFSKNRLLPARVDIRIQRLETNSQKRAKTSPLRKTYVRTASFASPDINHCCQCIARQWSVDVT